MSCACLSGPATEQLHKYLPVQAKRGRVRECSVQLGTGNWQLATGRPHRFAAQRSASALPNGPTGIWIHALQVSIQGNNISTSSFVLDWLPSCPAANTPRQPALALALLLLLLLLVVVVLVVRLVLICASPSHQPINNKQPPLLQTHIALPPQFLHCNILVPPPVTTAARSMAKYIRS
jgi:hypothetical protein